MIELRLYEEKSEHLIAHAIIKSFCLLAYEMNLKGEEAEELVRKEIAVDSRR